MNTLSTPIFNDMLALIEAAKNICIVTHINPDGDAIGSSFALAGTLTQLHKQVAVILPNDCPENLRWIEGYNERITFDTHKKIAQEKLQNADIIFCLDFNSISRLEGLGTIIQQTNAKKIIIDHHLFPEDFADITYSVTHASSTCELVYKTIVGCRLQHLLTPSIASALYTGIITDTGGLSHNSNSPELYGIVAQLLQIGIDKEYIHDKIFNNFSFDRMKLWGTILKENFYFLEEFNTTILYITKQNQKDFNFQLGDSEGFVNYPLSIRKVVFSALFTEYETITKISFRSKRTFPANQFAADYFNGGGHFNAAGGKHIGSLDEAIDIFKKGLIPYKDLLLNT